MLANIFRRLFENEGAGPRLRNDVVPWSTQPPATPDAPGALPPGGTAGQVLRIDVDGQSLGWGAADGFALLDIKPNIKGVVDAGFLSICVDNGELPSSVFPEAADLIKALKAGHGNVVGMAEYTAEQAAQGGVCARFALSEDGTKFRIPCAPGVFWRNLNAANGLTVGMWKYDTMRPITGDYMPTTTCGIGGTPSSNPDSFIGAFKSGSRGPFANRLQIHTGAQSTSLGFDSGGLGLHYSGAETAPVHAVCDYQMKMYGAIAATGTLDLEALVSSLMDMMRDARTGTPEVKIDFLPCRPADLATYAPGWHFCNGDLYPLSGAIGAALAALPANYKADWRIVVSGGNISIPNLFHTDGRGFFLRAVDGTVRKTGSIEIDKLRKITGQTYVNILGAGGGGSGALTLVSGGPAPAATLGTSWYWLAAKIDTSLLGENFAGTETAPLNIGMTPAIFLGV